MSDVTLRPAAAEDDEFLCAVYGSTREQELAQVPWDAAQRDAFVRFQYQAQRNHYQSEYPHAEHSIIMRDGQPVGRLYVDRRADEIHVMDITLLPQYRSQGVGTVLLHRLQQEAAEGGKKLSIHLDSFTRSHSLFLRLGFKPGETTGFHTLFVWEPAGAE